MLLRYGTSQTGKRIKLAEIYTLDEHRVGRNQLDKDALRIIHRLVRAGFSAYIVGGAIRDLILGRQPKDFDIVTNASPKKIKTLFWNSRIIGKRFRLVHIHFPEKIIEVSTFRANHKESNIYGSIEQDVKRRDFSINALYYSPEKELIIDFVHGFRDINNKQLNSVIPLDFTFHEDPVRMIRAIKYSVITGCKLGRKIKKRIRKHMEELNNCSSSRLTEELLKILKSSHAGDILLQCYKLDILAYILPFLHEFLQSGGNNQKKEFFKRMGELDATFHKKQDILPKEMLAALLDTYLTTTDEWESPAHDLFHNLFHKAKAFIAPLTPPNLIVEDAIAYILKSHNRRSYHRSSRIKRKRYKHHSRL